MADGQGDDFAEAFAKIAQDDADIASALAGDQGKADDQQAANAGDQGDAAANTAGDDGDAAAGDDSANAAADDAAAGGDNGNSQQPAQQEAKADQKAVAPEDAELLKNFASVLRKAAEAPQQQAPKPAQQEAPPEIYSDDEKRLLEDYEKDWPDIAKAEELRRKGEYRELVGFVFQTMGKHIAALNEQVANLAQRAHYGDLTSVVGPEYDDLVDKVTSWVDTQPTYLQAAYKNVVESGTPDEVKDLIDRYKRETGYQAPSANPAPTQTPEPKKTVLSSAAKQAAASLAPVASKRSAVSSSYDDLDFSSAFDQFASKM